MQESGTEDRYYSIGSKLLAISSSVRKSQVQEAEGCFRSIVSRLSEHGVEPFRNSYPPVPTVWPLLHSPGDAKQRGEADVDSRIDNASGHWRSKLSQDPAASGEAFSYHSYLLFTPPVDENGALHANPACSIPSVSMHSEAISAGG